MTDGADAPAVPLHVLEQRLEELATRVTSLTVADWAVACEVLCPELYAQPRRSRGRLRAPPGSRVRVHCYAKRVEAGHAVFSDRDTRAGERPSGAPPRA